MTICLLSPIAIAIFIVIMALRLSGQISQKENSCKQQS